jgi:hypothetical protein
MWRHHMKVVFCSLAYASLDYYTNLDLLNWWWFVMHVLFSVQYIALIAALKC